MSIFRIRDILKEKGVTGKELAKRIDTSEVTISNILNGKLSPRLETLQSIAQALDVEVGDLFVKSEVQKDEHENLYIKKGGKYVPVGRIDKDKL